MKTYIFDWKRTLYDPDNRCLIDGAVDVLELLRQQGAVLSLVGKGADDMLAEVERLGVKQYFAYIDFRDGAKDIDLYEKAVAGVLPHDIVFVGDRVRSELAVGKSIGAKTVWVRQGVYADELPESSEQEPDFAVSSLRELKDLLQNFA